ncbi:MAG: GNAT family N-acetyltransferase [Candidatus Dormibacteria bacterium]
MDSAEVGSQVSFSERPTIVGKLVTLRPVQVADAQRLVDIEPETRRLTGTHQAHSLAELERWYASCAADLSRLDLAIIDRQRGLWAGEVVLNALDSPNRSCGLRILLAHRDSFGRGLGTESVELVLRHAFQRVHLHRIELTVYAFNPRARHVYENLGFRREGTRREALLWEGAWVDAHTMAILSDEYTGGRRNPSSTRPET